MKLFTRNKRLKKLEEFLGVFYTTDSDGYVCYQQSNDKWSGELTRLDSRLVDLEKKGKK